MSREVSIIIIVILGLIYSITGCKNKNIPEEKSDSPNITDNQCLSNDFEISANSFQQCLNIAKTTDNPDKKCRIYFRAVLYKRQEILKLPQSTEDKDYNFEKISELVNELINFADKSLKCDLDWRTELTIYQQKSWAYGMKTNYGLNQEPGLDENIIYCDLHILRLTDEKLIEKDAVRYTDSFPLCSEEFRNKSLKCFNTTGERKNYINNQNNLYFNKRKLFSFLQSRCRNTTNKTDTFGECMEMIDTIIDDNELRDELLSYIGPPPNPSPQ